MPADHKMHIDEMKPKKGADFDNAYISMMIDDHTKDIAEFEKATNGNTDADVKTFASKTLPTLRKHLDQANTLKGKM